jgi:hypothetical protein
MEKTSKRGALLRVLLTKYFLCDNIKKIEMGSACSTYGVQERWWGTPEGKRPLGRPRSRLEDNIKIDPQEMGREGLDWMAVAEDKTGGGHL